MKKILKAILVLLTILCFSVCASAETFYTPIATRTAETAEPLTVGEDGLVRDPSGMIYGATKAYDDWLARMHAQGYATNAVAYRPLSVVEGLVYSDVNGALVGSLNGMHSTAELGDESIDIPVVCAAMVISLGIALLAGSRRRILGK